MNEELACFSLEGSSTFLADFVLVFEPFGKKANTKLRRGAFSEADSNVTGYCSLAEIEKFISSTLGKAYSDEEKAKKLFRLFRPIFRHAFNNAKAIRDGGNDVISGAQTATVDDYISFAEFRMFTVYLRIYAAMYDIFIKIDGNAVGENVLHTEHDDSRIDVTEFVTAFHTMKGNNLKGIGDVTSEEDMISLFNRVDTNNGGKLLRPIEQDAFNSFSFMSSFSLFNHLSLRFYPFFRFVTIFPSLAKIAFILKPLNFKLFSMI